MFYYLATFILILYLSGASLAVECVDCSYETNLTTSEELSTTRSDCNKKNGPGDICLASIIFDFVKQSAIVIFTDVPEQALVLSNRKYVITDLLSILFNKDLASHSVSWIGMNNADAVSDLNKIYNMSKHLKHNELRPKLREHLYTPQTHVSDLKCANNQNQEVSCENGFCQLTRSSNTNVDRKCVPNGLASNPSGITMTTTSTEGSGTERTIIYACNKAMCNGAETDTKVQQLLIDYGLWEKIGSQNSAGATVHQTMINFQCMLLLIIPILLKM